MAGSIIISNKVGVSMGSAAFFSIVEGIRSSFSIADEALRNMIYEPLDHEGMSFIAVDTQGKDEFNVFVQAVFRAHSTALSEFKEQVPREAWDDLISKLKADPRYKHRL